METRANHVLIGAFTLAVCLLAVLFALWAAKYTTEKSFNEYDVVFSEAVTGLSVGSQVLYNGISVGAVRRLSLDRDDPRKVIARIRLASDTPVKTDTRAKLALTGLTGVAIIQLTGGSPGSPALEPREGQRQCHPGRSQLGGEVVVGQCHARTARTCGRASGRSRASTSAGHSSGR